MLYVGYDSSVVQFDVKKLCKKYTKADSCVFNPFCGWYNGECFHKNCTSYQYVLLTKYQIERTLSDTCVRSSTSLGMQRFNVWGMNEKTLCFYVWKTPFTSSLKVLVKQNYDKTQTSE